jgi:hypothetical protein
MPIPATILVVDDQPLVRSTLRSLLAEQANWKVYEAEKRPGSPKPNPRTQTACGRLRLPETGIILISSHYTCEEAAGLARVFGDGNFIPKSEAGKELIPSINRLLSGERRARKASS